MIEFSAHIKSIQKVFMFFLSFCLVCWALIIDYRVYFSGLMVGATVSLINARYLAWKINKLTDSTLNIKKTSLVNLGFLTRAAIVTIAGLIAIKYNQFVSLPTVLVGTFFVHFVGPFIVLYTITIKKINSQSRKG